MPEWLKERFAKPSSRKGRIGSNPILPAINLNHNMKPVIIYALPRTRSTAVLYSCKRELKLFEPFAANGIHKEKQHDNVWHIRAELNNDFVRLGKWEDMVTKMNNINTVTKILCMDLFYFSPARKWFNDLVENQTHDVFIIERENREEILLSYTLAAYFGWHKNSEIAPYEFTVDDSFLIPIHNIIDNYLRFYPKRGKIITFANLPDSHFDKSLNHSHRAIDQQSSSKYKYIKNLDEFRVHIKHILDYYKDEWDSKIINLDQS